MGGAPDALEECLGSGMLRGDEGGIAFRTSWRGWRSRSRWRPTGPSLCTAALWPHCPPAGAPDLARLAHHAEAAADAPSVLRYAPAAAEHAAGAGPPREAQEQYARALRFAQGLPPELRAELLERFGDADYLTDMREEAVQALTEALRIHRARRDLRRQAGALRRSSRLLTCMGRTAEAKADAVEAIGLLEQVPTSPELTRPTARSRTCPCSPTRRRTRSCGAERAVALPNGSATPRPWSTRSTTSAPRAAPGVATGRARLERSLALARQAGLGPDVGPRLHQPRRDAGQPPGLGAGRSLSRPWDRVLPRARSRGLAEMPDRREDPRRSGAGPSGMRPPNWLPRSSTRPATRWWGRATMRLLVLALVRARRGDPQYWPLLDEALVIA